MELFEEHDFRFEIDYGNPRSAQAEGEAPNPKCGAEKRDDCALSSVVSQWLAGVWPEIVTNRLE
jgi:hypothetical protein